MKSPRHQLGWFLTGLGAVLIAGLTLLPQPRAITAVPSPRFVLDWGHFAGIDILLNIMLFIPIGVGLRLTGYSRRSAVAIAATLSGVIELLQVSVVAGRDSSVRDFLINTLGALIGVLLADGWKRWVFPSHAGTRRLLFLGAAFWLLFCAGEAALLGRAFPPTIWYGQWAPDEVFPATFSGHVLAVRLDSLDLPEGRLPNSDRVRTALRQDHWALTVNATTGEPTSDLSSVFSIFDGEQREMLVVGQQGIDLFVRYRTHAATVGLRSPLIVLPGAFALPPGEPIRISLSFDRGLISLRTTASGKTLSQAVPVTPSRGWSLLMPFEAPIRSRADLWSGLWLAALLFPTGYWMGRGIGTFEAVAFGGLLLFLGIGLTPLLFQLPSARPWEWIAGAAGLGTAWRLGRASLSLGPGRRDD